MTQPGAERKSARKAPGLATSARGPDVTVPAEYLAHLLEVARRFQVSSESLLRGTDVKLRALDEPHAVVSKSSFLTVVARALELTGEPGLGYYHGLSLKLSSHGALGMLAMTSGTLRDALHVAQRFVQLRATELSLRLSESEEEVVLAFENHVPSQLQVFFSESLFVTLLQVGRALVGHPIVARCEMPFPEPAHFRRFAHLLPGGVSFGAPENRLHIPRALLDEAVVTSDSVMARRIERDCERELTSLRERASVLHSVYRELRAGSGDYPSLEALAARLGSSTRTLKRKLAEQGVSFRQILDELRRERATLLLDTTDLSLDEIASRLGYSDAASLHRSFRRWFGGTPNAYRRRR